MLQLGILLLILLLLPQAEAAPNPLQAALLAKMLPGRSPVPAFPLLQFASKESGRITVGILALLFLAPKLKKLVRALLYRLLFVPLLRRRILSFDVAVAGQAPAADDHVEDCVRYSQLEMSTFEEARFHFKTLILNIARWARDNRREASNWRETPADYQRDLERHLAPFAGFEWGRRFRDTLVQQLGDFSVLPPHELFIALTRHANNLLRDRIEKKNPLPPAVEEALFDVLRSIRDEHVQRSIGNSR